jgi:tetratricopeptide (TPR) repeat protein
VTTSDGKRLCGLLYAYELDLLEESQRDEFEIHLLDCPRCRRQAEEFLPAAHLLKHDREIRGFVEGVEAKTRDAKPRDRKFWPAILAVAAIVVILILGPWQFQVGPPQEAIASENRLAVLYIPGDGDTEADLELGTTIVNLLATDLSESEYLQVVSAQHLFDVARRLGFGNPTEINQGRAARLAREVNARWMLTASIARDGAEQQLITQLIEVAGGEVRASHREAADTSATVFALVDHLSAQLKGDISLPQRALEEQDPLIADLTTHSVKAYQFFLKGVELTHSLYTDDAVAHFSKAVDLDSTFAMAYYYLSVYSSQSYIQKAIQYVDRATKKDQMFILAREASLRGEAEQKLKYLEGIVKRYPDEKAAFFQLGLHYYQSGRFMKAIYYLEQARRLDPLFKRPPNLLAYAHDELGRLDEALRILDEYQQLAPGEANPWDSRGDILARNGRLDEAIEAFRTAVKIKPDFRPANYKLLLSLMHNHQFEEVEAWVSSWEQGCHPDTCSDIHSARFQTLVYLGRYREALEIADKTIAAEHVQLEAFDNHPGVAWSHGLKATLLLELDSSGLAETQRAIDAYTAWQPQDRINYRVRLARCHIQRGELEEAEEVIAQLQVDLQGTFESQRLYWLGMGYLELARGNALKAADHFEQAANLQLSRNKFVARYMQARALLEAGSAGRAVEILEQEVRSYTRARMVETQIGPKVHYYLGIAYEDTGRKTEAIEQYQVFLDIWKNADRDLPEYIDANERLARLKATS